jgi:2,4'-dihydroxyacetophenone dioxygenase
MDIGEVLKSGDFRTADDQLRDPDALPWVPQGEGVWFRPLRFCPDLGSWTNLLRVTKKGTINLHRHTAPVEAWVISGNWRYLERDWVARPGTYVFEPAGDIHTLAHVGEQEMVTLFNIHGPIEYLGPDGEITFIETVETKLARYVEFCEATGTAIAPLIG